MKATLIRELALTRGERVDTVIWQVDLPLVPFPGLTIGGVASRPFRVVSVYYDIGDGELTVGGQTEFFAAYKDYLDGLAACLADGWSIGGADDQSP